MLDSPSAAAIVGLVAVITFASRIIGALVMTQVGILVSDVLYTLVDPRIRHA